MKKIPSEKRWRMVDCIHNLWRVLTICGISNTEKRWNFEKLLMLSSRRCLDIRNIASSKIPLNMFMTLSKRRWFNSWSCPIVRNEVGILHHGVAFGKGRRVDRIQFKYPFATINVAQWCPCILPLLQGSQVTRILRGDGLAAEVCSSCQGKMAAQSDFAKHGAVALSEVAAFDDFARKGRPSPLSLCSGLGKSLLSGAVQKWGNCPSGNQFVSDADAEMEMRWADSMIVLLQQSLAGPSQPDC